MLWDHHWPQRALEATGVGHRGVGYLYLTAFSPRGADSQQSVHRWKQWCVTWVRDKINLILLHHLKWEPWLDEGFLKSPFTAAGCKQCSKGMGEHQSLALPHQLLPHSTKRNITTHHGHSVTNVRLQWYLLWYNKRPSGKLPALFGRGTQIC